MSERQPSESPPPGNRPASPIIRLLDLFSSVWLGVALLCVLFIYSSIGSSGLPVRLNIFRPDAWIPLREALELSEYEWFHWWPFEALIALLCVNIIVATVRRIPLNVVNLGVWMIHGGIIILALGSVWYFSTKVEGDAPVARRRVVARVEGHEPASMIASPGNVMQAGDGEDAYMLQVWDIVPDWELLSGADQGERAYKVSVLVQGAGRMFVRELLAGYPQYTEDLIPSDNPDQPFVRARRELGRALVDEKIELTLDYQVQEFFYLAGSGAVYLREVGQTEWIERPVAGLPRFKDYIASYAHVWIAPGDEPPPLRPIELVVPPADAGDPLPDVTFRITEHVRYALKRQRIAGGGDRLNPAATVRITVDGGAAQDYELVALDPQRRTALGGALEFRWVDSEDALAILRDPRPPMLHIEVPAQSIVIDEPIVIAGPDEPFTPIAGSDYRYRVRATPTLADRGVSLAVVDIERGTDRFTRWVFDDPSLTRDLAEGEGMPDHAVASLLDENITMMYEPGVGDALHLVAGPDERALRLFVPPRVSAVTEHEVAVGEPIQVTEGATLTVLTYILRSRMETRPLIVPLQQRDRSAGARASMIRLDAPSGSRVESFWLPYHDYPFARAEETLRRFPYQPGVLTLDDGRRIELVFSRERMKLPAPVALETFEIDTHIGGFTGDESSILDWRSVLRFQAASGWCEPVAVDMNNPVEFEGLWFFQSSWDPPVAPGFEGDRGSRGLNYTILGVANRHGVFVQLLGCCIAVVGMIYAFYVKPYIRRRRLRRVMAPAAPEESP